MGLISWSSKPIMITGDELPWGHALFKRGKQKRCPHLAPTCTPYKQKGKKCVCKRPLYKLVPGATWICGRAALRGMALLFTLIYNKEREWWQASITWYTRYATAQSQQRLAFHILLLFFFFFNSVLHKYDYLISFGLDFMSLKHLCFLDPTLYHYNFHSMYSSS